MPEVLRTPGVLPLFAASCVARLPMGALGLLLVLIVEERTGSYAAGGAAAGVHVAAVGAGSPVLARFVDRHGQTAVLRVGAIVSAAAVLGIALLPEDVPFAALLACAVVAGLAQPPVGACMRALWPVLIEEEDRRHAAYSLEAVALEVVYIAGPVVVVGVIGSISLTAALLACAGAVLLGDVAFSAHPRSRGFPGRHEAAGDLVGALRGPGVRMLVVVFLVCGLTVGGVEVVVAASTGGDERGTGLLLGVWGVGSMVGGLAVARAGAGADAPRRLAVLVGAWGATHAVVGLADAPGVLAVLLLVAGVTIAPTLVTANGLLDRVAPPGTLTEAFTWTSTGITAGIAAGSAVAGTLVEAATPGTAMLVLGGVCTVGALAVARGGARALRPLAVAG